MQHWTPYLSAKLIVYPKLPTFCISLTLLACQVRASASNSVVNLSHYDTISSDFAGMRAEGVVSVIHEATYRLNRDAKYSARQEAATRARLLWGAYHFGDATDPIRQADYFLDVVRSAWREAEPTSRPTEVLLVLDFEKNHYGRNSMRIEQAAAFVERIYQRTGKYPGLYSNENRIRQVVNNALPAYQQILTKCWLWMANYNREPQTTSPWKAWDLWQYTGDGICALPRSRFPIRVANMRRAERNIFRGDETALKNFWHARAWQLGADSLAYAINDSGQVGAPNDTARTVDARRLAVLKQEAW